MMRKIILSAFISLDGVVQDPGGSEKFKHGGWTWPYHSKDIEKFKYDELFASGALLLGRVTYEGFAKAWPSMKDNSGFARRMNNIPKYVVSTKLKKLKWNNSILINKNIKNEIIKLKKHPGKDILILGSSGLSSTLMDHDIIDEYSLLVYPIIIGAGKTLFNNKNFISLEFVEKILYGSGVVLLRYKSKKSISL